MQSIPPRLRTIIFALASASIGAAIAVGAMLVFADGDADDVLPETAIEQVEPDEADASDELPRDPPQVFAALPAGYRIESFASGLTFPTAIDGAPDGRIFVTEQLSGNVRVISAGGVLQPDPWFTVTDLYIEPNPGFVSELGLVGVTVDRGSPDGFALLIYYSAISGEGVRSTKLVRLREQDGAGASPETIWETFAEPGCCHIGGALTWMPDGTLLVGVGDHERAPEAQDPSVARGKVLRMTRDGEPPADNPFFDRGGDARFVYAVGVRNPYGVAVDPRGETAYVLDNGELGFDTVHALRAGANYGWPSSDLAEDAVIEEPVHLYLDSLGLAAASVYRGRLSAFDGHLFFCQFHREGALHWMQPDGPPREFDRIVAPGCTSGMRVLPDEYIYFIDYAQGTILRITDGAPE